MPFWFFFSKWCFGGLLGFCRASAFLGAKKKKKKKKKKPRRKIVKRFVKASFSDSTMNWESRFIENDSSKIRLPVQNANKSTGSKHETISPETTSRRAKSWKNTGKLDPAWVELHIQRKPLRFSNYVEPCVGFSPAKNGGNCIKLETQPAGNSSWIVTSLFGEAKFSTQQA